MVQDALDARLADLDAVAADERPLGPKSAEDGNGAGEMAI